MADAVDLKLIGLNSRAGSSPASGTPFDFATSLEDAWKQALGLWSLGGEEAEINAPHVRHAHAGGPALGTSVGIRQLSNSA